MLVDYGESSRSSGDCLYHIADGLAPEERWPLSVKSKRVAAVLHNSCALTAPPEVGNGGHSSEIHVSPGSGRLR